MRTLIILISTLAAFLGGLRVQAQQISKVNFTAIHQALASSQAQYYFPKLLERYQRNDTTLTKEAYKHLYYGQTTAAGYAPYGKNQKKVELNWALQNEEYAKAVTLSKQVLATEPFDLTTLFALVASLTETKNQEAKLWEYKFRKLTEVILDSGDGLTKETAYVISRPSDEGMITNLLGLTVTSQSVVENKWDLLQLGQPNAYNLKALYFNIEKPLGTLSKKTAAKK